MGAAGTAGACCLPVGLCVSMTAASAMHQSIAPHFASGQYAALSLLAGPCEGQDAVLQLGTVVRGGSVPCVRHRVDCRWYHAEPLAALCKCHWPLAWLPAFYQLLCLLDVQLWVSSISSVVVFVSQSV